MERRMIPWLLLLLVAACYGAITPYRDKDSPGEDKHATLSPDTHIKQRSTVSGAELHAYALSDAFEAGQPQDLAAISFRGLQASKHKGFQFTSKDIINVRWYVSSDPQKKQRSCNLNGFFWECELGERVIKNLKPSDHVILRATLKADSITQPRDIRKDIMGLPNSAFSSIESVFFKAFPRPGESFEATIEEDVPKSPPSIPAPPSEVFHRMQPETLEEEGQQPQHTATIQEVEEEKVAQQPASPEEPTHDNVRRQVVPESLMLERQRRTQLAEERRALEVAARRVNAAVGARNLRGETSYTSTENNSPHSLRARQQTQPQPRRVREYSVSAEELAHGDRVLQRGGIQSNSDKNHDIESRGVQPRSLNARDASLPPLTTLISLNFDGMIPPNQCS